MGDVLDLLHNFINDKPAPDAKHLSRMAIARIKHLQQQIKEMKKAQDLSRREQFAMAALQGLLADPNNSDTGMDRIAGYSVEAADALLSKLNKAGDE